MKNIALTKRESRALAVLAALGFLIPNSIFVYYCIAHSDIMRAALNNPISLVFIIEAFFLMGVIAWLLKKAEIKRPGWALFIFLSLLGSMAFSVPFALRSIFKDKE